MATDPLATWTLTEERDAKGRPYWRARRDGYSRGAPTLETLRQLCAACAPGAPWRGTLTAKGSPMRAAALFHGDAVALLPTLPVCSADGVFTDPPYRLTSGGMKSKIHRGRHFIERAERTKGRLFPDAPTFDQWAEVLAAPLVRDAEALVMTNDRNLPAMWEALRRHGWKWHNLITWDKVMPVNNMWYQKQSEFILYLYRGRARRLRNLGATNVVRCMPVRKNKTHVSEKPVALIEALLRNHDWEAVLDPFMGSGSTGVAAVRLGIGFTGIELDEADYRAATVRIESTAPLEQSMQTPMDALLAALD